MLPELQGKQADIINLLAIIFAALVVGRGYIMQFLKGGDPPIKPSDPAIQIVGGALADRSSMMEVVKALDRVSTAIERHSQLMERRDMERERHGEIKELLRRLEGLERDNARLRSNQS